MVTHNISFLLTAADVEITCECEVEEDEELFAAFGLSPSSGAALPISSADSEEDVVVVAP